MAHHDESAGKLSDAEKGVLVGSIENGVHRLQARVYYADTDFSGVVYHARYLEFLERGRSDFLRLHGIHHTELLDRPDDEALVWIVRRMEIDFRAPAKIDDILTVQTSVFGVSGARVTMEQRIVRGRDVLIEAKVHAAIIDRSGRPRRLPADWRASFEETAGQTSSDACHISDTKS
ncbi:tol-pal system-associated acyl-CoA thioesterase [Notoacmeibacter sp. MSK16QG-6]|uniref:tol-pal system-associated acyl-CoA thioesterase n=1 Tax=Notoacmeibacter sp. MSK16QG-6 TaxID=2957982 RepID=UPI0020A099E6|nr:tol-pal system-associated acyl-CoA thioesterase [Notoacmeibacter sp. MSK16QG-6]MCP1200119.1 tol-pal system-associated acyl-CoA thioesterase [Notoacmeibacter sp. MSK16QG-6]